MSLTLPKTLTFPMMHMTGLTSTIWTKPGVNFAKLCFEKRHILRLEEVLQIPPLMKCNQRSVFTGTEGLCMLLKRLAYPCRYSDLIHRFGRPVPVLGMITNKVIDYIYNTHHHKITNWNNDILNPAALQM